MNRCRTWILVLLILVCVPQSGNALIFTVPDWLTDTCVFIMKNGEAKGTAFLVWVKEKVPDGEPVGFCYLVSAKHVLAPILSDPSQPLSVRFTSQADKKPRVIPFQTYQFKGKRWIEHDNPAIDIAAAPLTIFGIKDKLKLGYHWVETRSDQFFGTSELLREYSVRPGDRVFTLGLIPHLYDEAKTEPNLVLARFGSVSLLVDEEISLPGGKQKVYFLDCPAFGGNSGGPAFLLLERSKSGAFESSWRIALLGVVTEFIPSPLRMKEVDTSGVAKQKLLQLIENTGISKVVPVDYLCDMLFSEEQKEFRKKLMPGS